MPIALEVRGNAGESAANPILKGLGLEHIIIPTSADVEQNLGAFLDQAPGFPGTNDVSNNLSPLETVYILGANGSYNDTTKEYTLATTAGLSIGDLLYVSHPLAVDGAYVIDGINGNAVTVTDNSLDGLGAQTGITYQNCWRYIEIAGNLPTVSSAAGQLNVLKAEGEDSSSNQGTVEGDYYLRDAPTGSLLLALGGADYDAVPLAVVSSNQIAADILSPWADRGGVTEVAIGSNDTSSTLDATWWDGSTTPKLLDDIITQNAGAGAILLSAGDGDKFGKFLLRSDVDSSIQFGVNWGVKVDTSAPVLTLTLRGA
ncbi:MAG: hypothetical protein AAFY15_01980 [Cyanobacteria bacterium J06648_11]